jgi:hypothetical protein
MITNDAARRLRAALHESGWSPSHINLHVDAALAAAKAEGLGEAIRVEKAIRQNERRATVERIRAEVEKIEAKEAFWPSGHHRLGEVKAILDAVAER